MSRLHIRWMILLLLALHVPAELPAFQGKPAPPDSSNIPATDIVLFSLRDSAGVVSLTGKPTVVAGQKGYDNQPSFMINDKGILFSSMRDGKQTDIFLYDLAGDSTRQLTRTPESEYSPQQLETGGRFSAVRVEPDSGQRIWVFPFDTGAPVLLARHIKDVAYYAWLGTTGLGVIELQRNFNSTALRVTDVFNSRNSVIASNTGRCITKIPQNPGLSFLQVQSDTAWVFVYDLEYFQTLRLVPALPGREDFAWGPNRTLYMSDGSKLFYCRPPIQREWKEAGDLAQFGFTGITRLAVSRKGDKIAFVIPDQR